MGARFGSVRRRCGDVLAGVRLRSGFCLLPTCGHHGGRLAADQADAMVGNCRRDRDRRAAGRCRAWAEHADGGWVRAGECGGAAGRGIGGEGLVSGRAGSASAAGSDSVCRRCLRAGPVGRWRTRGHGRRGRRGHLVARRRAALVGGRRAGCPGYRPPHRPVASAARDRASTAAGNDVDAGWASPRSRRPRFGFARRRPCCCCRHWHGRPFGWR